MGHFSVLALSSGCDLPLWLTELHCEEDRILGKVSSASGRSSLAGQQYETSLKNIVDWLFVHNYRLIGAYSFREKVARIMEYMEYLVTITQGAPTRPGPSEEEQEFFNKLARFCLPLNEEAREGPLFELFDAIGNHEQEAVLHFLSDRNLIDEPCEVFAWFVIDVHRKKLPPLLYAINCKNEAASVELIKAGAQLDLQNDLGMTALHYAVTGFPNLVRLLAQKGACLHVRNNAGLTALDIAVGGEHECARILIEAGADVNAYHEQLYPGSTLRVAVSPVLSGSLDLQCARILSEAGANFHVMNLEGESALHIAATNGKFDLAEFLITLGCDPTARSNEGETPASLALKYRKDSASAARFADYCKNASGTGWR